MSLPETIRTNFNVNFPASVIGSGPVVIAKQNGVWTIGLNGKSLTEVSLDSDDWRFLAYNASLDTWATGSVSDSFLVSANNLSDIPDPPTARTNLGLGTAATHDEGDFILSADAGNYLQVANDLSDLNDAPTARTNLGLGSSATHAVGDFLQTANNLSDLLDPAVARINLGIGTVATHAYSEFLVTADAATFLQVANDLSDLNNAATARTNLGLGVLATKGDGDYGDITVSSSGAAWAVDSGAITYAKIQDVSATNTLLGRKTAGAGVVEELSGTDLTAILDIFTDSLQGLVPASGGGTSKYLRADGSWAAVTGMGTGDVVGPASSTTGYIATYADTSGKLLDTGIDPTSLVYTSDIGSSVQAYDSTILVDADIGVNVQAYDSTILVDADIGVNVQAYDSTILVDADIGVNVQAYDSTILVDADIGVNVQAYDDLLSDISGITPTEGDVFYYDGANIVALGAGDDDQVLTLASGVPTWADAAASGSGVQSGSIVKFSGLPSAVPSGLLLCDGANYTQAGKPDLYSAIGDKFSRSTNVFIASRTWRNRYNDPRHDVSTLGSWEAGTSLPGALAFSQAIVTKDRVYLLGGTTGSYVSTVYTAPINSDGTLGSWTTGTSLPGALGASQAIVTKDRVYLLGGNNGSYVSTVYTAPINSDGTLGSWTTGTSLPGALGVSQAIVTKDRVYLLGGYNGSAYVSTVYTAPINSDGTLGSWTTGTSLPGALGSSQAIVTKDRVYLLGGTSVSTAVYTAPINSDGTLGSWAAGTSLPGALTFSQAIVTKDRVYLLGGNNGSYVSTVYTAPINSDGTLGSWTTGTSLPGALGASQAIVTKDRVYLLGGNNGSYVSTVYTATLTNIGSNDYLTGTTLECYLPATGGSDFAVPRILDDFSSLGNRIHSVIAE